MGPKWTYNCLFEDHEKRKLSDLLKVTQEELRWFYSFLFKIDIAVFLYYFTMSERGLRVYVNLLQKLDHVSKDHYT